MNNKFKFAIVATIIFIIFIIVGIILINKNNQDYEIEKIEKFLYFRLYENEKYGVIDDKGNIIIEPKYEILIIPNPSKAVFIGYLNYNPQNEEYKTEVLNEKNEKILTNYEQILPIMLKDSLDEVPYEKSVLTYKENEKYGLINFKGKKITKAIYDSIESLLYKEGCLLVKQDEKYGVINIKGNKIIDTKFDSITADGYYDNETKYQKAGFVLGNKTQDGYRYGYNNSEGEKILEVEYNEVSRITEINSDSGIYILALKNGQAGVYRNDKIIINHNYNTIDYNKQSGLFMVKKDQKQGVIDKDGKQILNIEYDNIIISSQNITAEKDGNICNFDIKGNKNELEGNNIIFNTYNNYNINIDKQDQFGITDIQGNVILKNEYSYIDYAFDNYFIVTKNGKVSVIDVSKNIEVISNYSVIQKIENKNILQAISIHDNNSITELYNQKLEKIVLMNSAKISIKDNYIIVLSENERKYFDNNGNEIKNTELFSNLNLFAFNQEGKWGFVNKDGETKVNPVYDMVTEQNEYGFAGIKLEGKWGIINSNGEVIVSPTYEIQVDEPDFIGQYCRMNFGYGMIYYTKDLIKK